MEMVICYLILIQIQIVFDMKIKSFKIEPDNVTENNNVRLTCTVEDIQDIDKVNIEILRIYSSSNTILSTETGKSQSVFVLRNVTCEDLGVYECRCYQNGSRQNTWNQKLLDLPCMQTLKQSEKNERDKHVQFSITILSNPQSKVTWYRSSNEPGMLKIVNDSNHMTYTKTHYFEPFKMTYMLDAWDIMEDTIYIAISHQSQYDDIKSFLFQLKDLSEEVIDTMEFDTVRCNPALAVGWITSALLFLTLLFICLVLAIIKRKGKSLRESLQI